MAGIGGQEEGVFGKLRRVIGRTKGPSPEEAAAKESEARLQALDIYIKRLKNAEGLKRSGLGYIGSELQRQLQSLKTDFGAAKSAKPELTAKTFLQEKAGSLGHIFVKSDGWQKPAVDTTLNNPEPNLGHSYSSSDMGTLLGEAGSIDLNTRFSKWSDSVFSNEKTLFYGPKGSGWFSETSFSKWSASNQKPEEKAAGISVTLIRENEKPDPQDRAYFTGGPGGVRGFSLSVSNDTLVSFLDSKTAYNIGE